MRSFLVFDVESVGLHGEGYAVAGGVYREDGAVRSEFRFAIDPDDASGTEGDRAWIAENIPTIKPTHEVAKDMRSCFLAIWLDEKRQGTLLAADCAWPVEARFLLHCIREASSEWDGPYPLIDISSVLLAVGLDPLANYHRLENELPKHDPLADVRQSARLLIEALNSQARVAKVAEAGEKLNAYLDKNVGTTADWPIEITASDDEADSLCLHLNDLRKAVGPEVSR